MVVTRWAFSFLTRGRSTRLITGQPLVPPIEAPLAVDHDGPPDDEPPADGTSAGRHRHPEARAADPESAPTGERVEA